MCIEFAHIKMFTHKQSYDEAGARHLGAFDEQLTRSNYIYQLQENSFKKKYMLCTYRDLRFGQTFMFSVHKFNRQVRDSCTRCQGQRSSLQ